MEPIQITISPTMQIITAVVISVVIGLLADYFAKTELMYAITVLVIVCAVLILWLWVQAPWFIWVGILMGLVFKVYTDVL